MADEQLLLTIEQHAESARTAMTWEDAKECLDPLTVIIEKESMDQESVNDGRLHEIVGQIFRSLVPAFVMTDADYKVPGSLAQPTKNMIAVKQASFEWLNELVKNFPQIAKQKSVNLVQYRRRMHMTVLVDDDEEDNDVEDEESGSSDDDNNESENDSDLSSEEDDENTPPSELNARNNDPTSSSKKQTKVSATTTTKSSSGRPPGSKPSSSVENSAQISLDPVVALFERLAVRCPDKTEWRKSICDSIAEFKQKDIVERFLSKFIVPFIAASDKAAWRVFGLECIASTSAIVRWDDDLQSSVLLDAVLKRTTDSVASVRSAAMKAYASLAIASTSNNADRNETTISNLTRMLHERSKDEKPMVRRTAISVFDQVVSILGGSNIPLEIAENFSFDESLMVRKSSISSIVYLVVTSSLGIVHVEELYCRTVLQMVTDVETSVVEKVVEAFEEVIISPIRSSASASKTIPDSLQKILKAIGSSKDSVEYAKRTVRLICRKYDSKEVKAMSTAIEKLIKAGLNDQHIDDKVLFTLVSFMEEIVSTSTSATVAFATVVEFWKTLESSTISSSSSSVCISLIRTIVRVFTSSKNFSGSNSLNEIIECMDRFVKSPRAKFLGVLHDACRCLFVLKNSSDYFESLMTKAETEILPIVYPNSDTELDEWSHYTWWISCMGEIAALGAALPSAKGLTAIEAIATNRVYHEGGLHVPLPPNVRGIAMVSFGKICLGKESIAKRAVSKFVAHLSHEEHPIVRNNVLIVIGDLCVVYTGLVDQYLPWVTRCLADENDLIRYQASVVVSSLLAEDYIKFKGQIVFRLLFLLSDPNVQIRRFVESVFSRILFLRHSASLKTLFAETVCALNGYLRHPSYQGAMGNRDFALTNNRTRRNEIYKFMLANVVTTEQKFNAIVQLANSLLAAFVDEDLTNGHVQIPEKEEMEPAAQVLIDTLYLLSCQELKLSSGGPGQVAAEAAATEPAGDEDKETREKKMFDAALQKKTVVENLVPLLIQLNSQCEKKRSPMSRYVRDCLRELVKDYREEIMAIVHADSQLAQELLYDINALEPVPEVIAPAAIADMEEQTDVAAPVAEEEKIEEPVKPVKQKRVESPPRLLEREDSPAPVRAKSSRRAAASRPKAVKDESEDDVEFEPSKNSSFINNSSSSSSSSSSEEEADEKPQRRRRAAAGPKKKAAPAPPRKRKQ